YTSIHRARVRRELRRNKSEIDLQKKEKHIHFRLPGYPRKLPSWEPIKRADKDKLPETNVNFRKRNILNVKKSRPRQPKKRYVDTRFGDSHDLEPSGLLPIYVFRKDRGKWLDKKKSDIKKTGSKIESAKKWKEMGEKGIDLKDQDEAEAKRVQSLCRYITQEQRANLLEGMKKKWDEMMKQFQCLPFLTDTPPKAKRKAKMEEALSQLEKDIEIIQRHPYIYVYSDDEDE
ncbi:enkurin, partial [Orussus abietinus]|uniref:enkurin n=1 Tax=Orussus abietinus TaxID=222816 RepID=UPI000C716137